MNALLLGGCGFIGKNLSLELIRQGHKVTIFDNTFQDDLNSVALNQIKYIRGDFTDFINFDSALNHIDVVYHLISTTLPANSNLNPEYDIQENVVATIKFLEMARIKRLKKIIFFSSGGTVYGEPKFLPITEMHSTNPLCSYGIQKLTIEKYLSLYYRLYGIEYVVLRVSNPYGPYQKLESSQGLINSIIYKIQNQLPIEVWGDGTVIRDYIHVQDVVSAGIMALDYSGLNNIFNISSGEGLSVNEVIRNISKYIGKKAKIIYLDEREFDVKTNILSNELARKELGWDPTISLEEYIEKIK